MSTNRNPLMQDKQQFHCPYLPLHKAINNPVVTRDGQRKPFTASRLPPVRRVCSLFTSRSIHSPSTAHSQPIPGPFTAHSRPLPAHSRPIHGPLPAHSRPIPGPLTAHPRTIHGPLPAYSRPIHGPFTAHTRPIHGPFTAHSRPIPGPLPAHSWSTHCRLPAHSRSTYGPFTAHSRPIHDPHGPSTAHSRPIHGPFPVYSRSTHGPFTDHLRMYFHRWLRVNSASRAEWPVTNSRLYYRIKMLPDNRLVSDTHERTATVARRGGGDVREGTFFVGTSSRIRHVASSYRGYQ